jgi:hypothetical protein
MTERDRAKAIAEAIRSAWPQKAAEIDRLVAEYDAGHRDSVGVRAGIAFKLEKFHGPIEPGKQPYEVIEGRDD